jgi:DNA-binding GntR family transcriptional regulator
LAELVIAGDVDGAVEALTEHLMLTLEVIQRLTDG